MRGRVGDVEMDALCAWFVCYSVDEGLQCMS